MQHITIYNSPLLKQNQSDNRTLRRYAFPVPTLRIYQNLAKLKTQENISKIAEAAKDDRVKLCQIIICLIYFSFHLHVSFKTSQYMKTYNY